MFKSNKSIKILVCFVLVSLMLLCGCDNKTQNYETYTNEEILAKANKMPALIEGKAAVLSTLNLFTIYDNESYNNARKKADISPSLQQEYFPTVNYAGSDFMAIPMTATCTELGIVNFTDSEQEYIIKVVLQSKYGSTTYFYDIVYSNLLGYVNKITKIMAT